MSGTAGRSGTVTELPIRALNWGATPEPSVCTMVIRSLPPSTSGTSLGFAVVVGGAAPRSARMGGGGTSGGVAAGLPTKPTRSTCTRSPDGPTMETSAVASVHCGATSPFATSAPSRSTRTPSRRSTTSQRWLMPSFAAGTGCGCSPVGAIRGVPGATSTCAVVLPALEAIRARTLPGGRPGASTARSDTCSAGVPDTVLTGPGTRSRNSSPSTPGASVSTTNRPSSSASASANGVRDRSATGAAAQLLLITSRRASSPWPGVARAQFSRVASRHRVGSGALAWSNRSSSAYLSSEDRSVTGVPDPAVGAERLPNWSTERTSTRYFTPSSRPLSWASGCATSTEWSRASSLPHRTSNPGDPPVQRSWSRCGPVCTTRRSGACGFSVDDGSTTPCPANCVNDVGGGGTGVVVTDGPVSPVPRRTAIVPPISTRPAATTAIRRRSMASS